MKCPKCKDDMLRFPILQDHKVLSYWLCLNCTHRIIVHCKWRTTATIGSFEGLYWCLKMDEPCNTKNEPCGYQRCPQIREWTEQNASWIVRQNKKFEEKEREKRKELFERCRKVYEGIKRRNKNAT